MRKIIYNFFLVSFLVGIIDFAYTKINISYYFFKKQDFSSLYKVNRSGKTVLKENLNDYKIYNKLKFKICTNNYGFRTFCDQKSNTKKLGTVFTGDSLLFGTGLDIEKTFFGLINQDFPKTTNIADENSDLRDSFDKVKNLLNNGYEIDKVLYFFDISDIQDESFHKKSFNNNIQKKNDVGSVFNLNKLKIFIKNNFSLTYNLLVNIKYYNLPKPVYRYKYNYQRSAWTYNSFNSGYEPLGVNKTIEEFVLVLEDFFLFLSTRNIEFSIVVIPWPNQILYDDLKNSNHVKVSSSFCKNRCKELINFYPKINSYVEINGKKKTIKDIYLKGDMHLSLFGHKFIADHLRNFFDIK